ncbi:MAG: DUF99 family protein [Myxococcales bacterium]|nr:DUF99 family protein [Myxococcales bacterium]
MGKLAQLVQAGRTPCAIGFDDAPFPREAGHPVHISGIVCNGTRFEGMLWGLAHKDGMDATEALLRMLDGSKFTPQLHVILTDGVTFGGFNVVDLSEVHQATGLPCVSVMRRAPDLAAIHRVIERLPQAEERKERMRRAGPVFHQRDFHFQVLGAEPEDAALALGALTDRGKVPEPLRLAHLIGSAIVTGESSKRA